MHSHLLPAIDDGVKSVDESLAILRAFADLGYQKVVTTPHVMSDVYRNTPPIIREKLAGLKRSVEAAQVPVEVEAAAEYYLDENLLAELASGKERLLTIGENFLLFETNFLSEPFQLKEFIFQATSKGYKPVLAHPERYLYLQNDFNKVQDLLDRGVLFQVNLISLTGYYSPAAQKCARRMIDQGWVHFLGSDCHHIQQIELCTKAMGTKHFEKAVSLPLLNNSLL